LVEVVFPPSMSIGQAKEYIYRELQELPVRAAGHSLAWIEEPERVVLRLADVPLLGTLPVVLEPGVREMVARAAEAGAAGPAANGAADTWQTCCVEFERQAGWHRQRAEDWVQRHLGLRDLGRTARLAVPHRMAPALAAFVSGLLPAECYQPGGAHCSQ